MARRRRGGGLGEADFEFGHVSEADRERDLDAEFEEFNETHPQVFPIFVKLARQALLMKFKTYSPDEIIHVMRWTYAMKHGPEKYRQDFPRFNARFATRFARKLIEQDQRFQTFFIFRPRKQ